MSSDIPIRITDGITLQSKSTGIMSVKVDNPSAHKALSWDRFVRLKATADALLEVNPKCVLDVGGFDGALGLFMPNLAIDLIDPATTGGSVLDMPAPDKSYDAVVAVDVLEHIMPEDRCRALSELARTAARYVILNYPCAGSKEAQELAFKLTNNDLIKEHVQWALPDSDWVLNELKKHGFEGIVKPHTNIAIWLGQYVALHLAPTAAPDLNLYLVERFSAEPFSHPLYHLVICQRCK